MKKNIYISVSTDPIEEYQEIVEYAKKMQGNADFLHCDIMDGKFVEKTTFDAQLVYNINQNSLIALDVHLMVCEPARQIEDYIKAGANIITVHYEAFEDKNKIVEVVKKLKSNHVLAGLSIKPETQIKDIKMFIHELDLILVMSVKPGLSGQKFMPESLDKIRQLDLLRRENDYKFKIEVDGGVNDGNAKTLIESGVDILVSGSYIYKSPNQIKALESLKNPI